MKRINTIVTLYSLTALVIIIERLLPATRMLLQPYNFIRLHELNQTVIFLTITVILSFFVLQSVTGNFQALQQRANVALAAVFLGGAYLYGAGEGWHEVASFTLNTYCDTRVVAGDLCNGLFINDYYAGNLIFFVGGVLMNSVLLVFATQRASERFDTKDMAILLVNSLVYAFTWFAYAAFDVVLLGLFFAALLALISLVAFAKVRWNAREYPYITYGAVAYTLATIATVLYRFA
ncbi:MAG TPA: hypothetical protein PLO33_12255 [Kouleothrix sp.]|uniref:hypothetical protein n=1 Tax=Kouleothrix sp. TaxID=2779161 RepID=UPI002D1C096B|nr:hypothetical protein [Kouleothrix sp.]HRC76439.1 hypothetical protein [Kouleothrix sp.]